MSGQLPTAADLLEENGELRARLEAAEALAMENARLVRELRRELAERDGAGAPDRHTEERFRAIVEGVHEGVWTVDACTTTTFVNRRMAEMLGYTPEEMIGRKSTDFMREGGGRFVADRLERRRAGAFESFELELVRKDGTPLWAIANASPLVDASGTFAGSVGLLADITERKAADEAQRASEAKYRNLFENMTEEVHLWELVRDGEGRITTWRLVDANPPALRTWGKTLEDIKGKTTDEIFGAGSTDHYLPVVEKITSTGLPHSFDDYFPNLDRHFRFTSIPLGERFITTGADITSIKKANEALTASERRLRRFYDSGLVGALYWTIDGRVTDANQRFLEITGYTREDLVAGGIDWSAMTPSEYRHLDDRSMAELRATGVNSMPFEKEYIRKDGSRVPVVVAGAMLDEERVEGVAFVLDITERKRVEDSLRRSADGLREANAALRRQADLIDLTPDAIMVRGTDGTISLWSTGAEELYGWRREQAVGRVSHDLLGTGFPVPFDDIMATLASTGRWSGELVHRAKDGRRVVVQSRWLARRNEQGEITELLESNVDITERKLIEDALRDLNASLEQRVAERTTELRNASAYNRNLLETSLDPLVTISPDGKVTDVNAATERASGRSRTELIGTDFSAYFTDPGRAREGYQQVFREGTVQDYPLEIRHRDGRVTSVLYNASVYRDERGDVAGVFAAARDVTARRAAEDALRRAGAYNRNLLETSLDPLVTISPDGKVTDVNVATERVTGRSRQELIGTDFSDYFTEPERAREGYRQVFREGSVQDYPLEVRHRDGRLTPVLYNASVYRDEAGEVTGVFAAARDVTERRRAEAEVRAYQQHLEELVEHRTAELRRSNENLEQFAYVASHDLQEPLRMMASYSQLLERRYRGSLDADASEFIGYIVDGAQRMQGLINDLLAYSRVGRTDTPVDSVDCNAVLQKVRRALAAAVEHSGAVITSDPLPVVTGSESQIAQLLQNLVGNAIKFHGSQPPRVHVGAAERDAEWLFSVKDNGIGIEPQYAERIFQVFQRLHARGEYPGTGIGLAICRKIVEARGGRIWVESEPGRGSTFHFTFPRKGEAADA